MLSAEQWIEECCLFPEDSGCGGCFNHQFDGTCRSWQEYRRQEFLITKRKDTTWMRVFKIKRSDGKFKDKGNNNNFSVTGGMWRTKGLLRAHITMNGKDKYKDCVIVEYQLEQFSQESIL